MAWLNHAGTSWPKPAPVVQTAHEVLQVDPATWPERFDTAHRSVAAHFGVDPATLLITPGCTQALAVALADLLQPGDHVLTSGLEHHALMRPLHKARARVTVVPPTAAEPLDLDRLAAHLAGGDVRVVAMSMASNVTGALLPWAEVVALAHDHGALVVLDGAQVAGWTPLDLAALEVDVFAFAGHKGPQAPPGVGGLYVRPGLVLDTPAAACDGEACLPRPGYCDTGSVALPALCGLAEGLAWMRAHAPLEAARALEASFRERARTLPGVRIVGDVADRMPTCSLVVDGGPSPAELAARMARHDVHVRGGTQCAPAAHDTLGTGAAGTLRLSVGPTTPAADLDLALDALEAACGS